MGQIAVSCGGPTGLPDDLVEGMIGESFVQKRSDGGHGAEAAFPSFGIEPAG